jgi:hypothetical protein
MFPAYQNYELNYDRRANRRVFDLERKRANDGINLVLTDEANAANTFFDQITLQLLNIYSLFKEAQTYFSSTQTEQIFLSPEKKRIKKIEEQVSKSPQLNLALGKAFRELQILYKNLKDKHRLFNYLPANKIETIKKDLEKIDNEIGVFLALSGDLNPQATGTDLILDFLGSIDKVIIEIDKYFRRIINNYTPLSSVVNRPISFDADIKPLPTRYL